MVRSRHRRGRRPGRHACPRESLRDELQALLRPRVGRRHRRERAAVLASVVGGAGLLVVAVLTGMAGLGHGVGPMAAGGRGAGGATSERGPAATMADPQTPQGKAADRVSPGARGGPTAAGAVPAQGAAPVPAHEAMDFLRRYGGRAAARHAKEARWSGEYLRVYTDLDEFDDNSKAAVQLCRTASSYLSQALGKAEPVVFIHAKESGNGHVVLANKLNARDSCRVG